MNQKIIKVPVSVVFLGPPASGKGTTAEFLFKKYGIHPVSPGNIFKKIRNEKSELSDLVIETTKNGGLCPDWLTNEVVKSESLKLIKNGANSISLDGYPRTIDQLNFLNNNYDVHLFLHCSTHWMTLKKMVTNRRNCASCKKVFSMCGQIDCSIESDNCAKKSTDFWEQRWDDSPDFFEKRYLVYKNETMPVIKEVSKLKNYLKLDLFKNESYLEIEKLLNKKTTM